MRKLIAQDGRIPEIATCSVTAQMAAGILAGRRFAGWRGADLAPRPLRLLQKPEPIEAVAEVPDGPPLRFRWRRALHEVIAAEGPERIEGAWWSERRTPRGTTSASRTKWSALLAISFRSLPRCCARRGNSDLVPAWDLCVSSYKVALRDALSPIRLRLNFSFLRGASHPEELMVHAAHLGLAYGLCNRNSVAGVVCARIWPSASRTCR